MAGISIKQVVTTDANGKAKNYFEWDDPFRIQVKVERNKQFDSSAYPMEVLAQVVNLRGDSRDVGPWRSADGNVLPSIDSTVEWWGEGKLLVCTFGWKRYADMMDGILGGTVGGVYVVRATARLMYFPDFAISAPHAASYHFPGYPKPSLASGGSSKGSGSKGSGSGGSKGAGGGGGGDSGARVGRGAVVIVKPSG